MKVLLITKNSLQPISDGLKLRLYNFFRYLSKNHQISNLYLDNANQLVNFDEYDMIVLGGYGAIKNFSIQIKKPLVVDLVDDVYLNLIRGSKFEANLLRQLRLLKWAFDQKSIEKEWGKNYQNFIVASQQDATSLRRFCPSADIAVIANGVDTDFFKPSLIDDVGCPTLVFSGSMDYPPNDDAAWFFLNRIYPLIKARFSRINAIIVGKSPSDRIRSFAKKDTDVTITGFVDDIRPYIAKASVYICPLRWGTGVKNKILEAWAMGKAIVATPISTEGLKVNDSENILIARTPKDFAQQIHQAIEDKELRARLGHNGRLLVEHEYTWGKKSKEYESFLIKHL